MVPRVTGARLRPSLRSAPPLPLQSASTTTVQMRSLPYQFQVAPSGPPERQARSDSPCFVSSPLLQSNIWIQPAAGDGFVDGRVG